MQFLWASTPSLFLSLPTPRRRWFAPLFPPAAWARPSSPGPDSSRSDPLRPDDSFLATRWQAGPSPRSSGLGSPREDAGRRDGCDGAAADGSRRAAAGAERVTVAGRPVRLECTPPCFHRRNVSLERRRQRAVGPDRPGASGRAGADAAAALCACRPAADASCHRSPLRSRRRMGG